MTTVAVLVGIGVSGGGPSPPNTKSPRATTPAASDDHHHAPRLRYTAAQVELVDAIDVAAGNAERAAMSPDGTYAGRTAEQWCGKVSDAASTITSTHSVAWADRVDRATDSTSRKLHTALQFCG